MENVPGLLQQQVNAPYVAMLQSCMVGLPLVWRVQILCPGEHMGEGLARPRVVFAGVRVDLVVEGGCPTVEATRVEART